MKKKGKRWKGRGKGIGKRSNGKGKGEMGREYGEKRRGKDDLKKMAYKMLSKKSYRDLEVPLFRAQKRSLLLVLKSKKFGEKI